MKIYHYVLFQFPNQKSIIKRIKKNDIKCVKIPKDAIGLFLYDKIKEIVIYKNKKFILSSQKFNQTKFSIDPKTKKLNVMKLKDGLTFGSVITKTAITHNMRLFYAGYYQNNQFVPSQDVIQTDVVEFKNNKKVQIPETTFQIILFDQLEKNSKIGNNVINLQSEPIYRKKYLIGNFISAEQIRQKYGELSNYYKSIQKNNYVGFVKSSFGAFVGVRSHDLHSIITPDHLNDFIIHDLEK